MTQNKKPRIALKIILPLLILIIGVVGFNMLGKLKKNPQRQQAPQLGVLVDVMELRAGPHQVRVHATGTVTAEQEIPLIPEISGKVVWMAAQLVNGGIFAKGEPLLKIEATDYQLAVEKAQAEVAKAEVSLRTEQEQARIAMQEWKRIDLPDKGTPGPLVSHEIQLLQQQANLAAAKANLKQAELSLARTTLSAPFAGRIRQEQVDLGQYLRAGTSIGSLAGTARAEVQVPLPLDELRWIDIPATPVSPPGSKAMISPAERPELRWEGRITRSLGEIDATSRMATVVITINDPYALNSNKGQVLQNGQFVNIEILGTELEEVIQIPRSALRSEQKVWIADGNNQLQIRPVKILRREQRQYLVGEGIASGEKLILTTLSGAADGLLLRPVLQESKR